MNQKIPRVHEGPGMCICTVVCILKMYQMNFCFLMRETSYQLRDMIEYTEHTVEKLEVSSLTGKVKFAQVRGFSRMYLPHKNPQITLAK